MRALLLVLSCLPLTRTVIGAVSPISGPLLVLSCCRVVVLLCCRCAEWRTACTCKPCRTIGCRLLGRRSGCALVCFTLRGVIGGLGSALCRPRARLRPLFTVVVWFVRRSFSGRWASLVVVRSALTMTSAQPCAPSTACTPSQQPRAATQTAPSSWQRGGTDTERSSRPCARGGRRWLDASARHRQLTTMQ